jgi:hypothetical protein
LALAAVIGLDHVTQAHAHHAAAAGAAGEQVAAADRLHLHHHVAGAAGKAGAQEAVAAEHRHGRAHRAAVVHRAARGGPEDARHIHPLAAVLEEQPHRVGQVVGGGHAAQQQVVAVAEEALELFEAGDQHRQARVGPKRAWPTKPAVEVATPSMDLARKLVSST